MTSRGIDRTLRLQGMIFVNEGCQDLHKDYAGRNIIKDSIPLF